MYRKHRIAINIILDAACGRKPPLKLCYINRTCASRIHPSALRRQVIVNSLLVYNSLHEYARLVSYFNQKYCKLIRILDHFPGWKLHVETNPTNLHYTIHYAIVLYSYTAQAVLR